jgi:hypothetical protein
LENIRPLDCTETGRLEDAFDALVERLCPRTGPGAAKVTALIDHARGATLLADPGGLDAEPSEARDALAAALLHFRIEDPLTEGLALMGLSRAAQLLLGNVEVDHPAAYNMQMCLGECLAVATHQDPHYRQVAQQYLELEGPEAENPVLAFVVTRAYSKLAEISPTLIDLGTLLRIATQLDANARFNNKKTVVASLLGRVAAKLRGTDLGELLIQTLRKGVAAARVAAIGGISMCERQARSVYYLSELAAIERPSIHGRVAHPSRLLSNCRVFSLASSDDRVREAALRGARGEANSAASGRHLLRWVLPE